MSSFQSLVQGERTTGADVRTQNVTAVQAVANIVKSSLGPVGLDKVWVGGEGAGATDRWGRERRGFFFVAPPPPRSSSRSAPHAPALSPPRQMLVDDIGDVTITNDGATILKLLEVEHPAAKVRGREKGRERWMGGRGEEQRARARGGRARRPTLPALPLARALTLTPLCSPPSLPPLLLLLPSLPHTRSWSTWRNCRTRRSATARPRSSSSRRSCCAGRPSSSATRSTRRASLRATAWRCGR